MVDPVSLIAAPVVKTVVALASDFLMEQYHLVYGVGDEVVKLESNLTAINASLEDVNGILSDTNSQPLQDWLIKLKDSALDVEDVLEIYAEKGSRMRREKHRLVAKPLLRREAAQEIKKIAARINEISDERRRFHPNRKDAPKFDPPVLEPYDLQQTGSSRDSSDIFGREEEKEKIVKWMLSEESDNDIQGEVCVLPITGTAGLGKTTLAQLVYNDVRAMSHFDHRIWIDVTIRFNLKNIGKEMIEGITDMKHPLSTWSSIVTRIEEVLSGKRFLLILDDLWNQDFADWDKLRQLLKKGRRGSRILITSRISEIAKTVGARHTHFLDFLSEEACWSLFVNIAFTGDQGQPALAGSRISEIGRQIVHHCNGLPLAVTAMAVQLRGCADVTQWAKVLREGIF